MAPSKNHRAHPYARGGRPRKSVQFTEETTTIADPAPTPAPPPSPTTAFPFPFVGAGETNAFDMSVDTPSDSMAMAIDVAFPLASPAAPCTPRKGSSVQRTATPAAPRRPRMSGGADRDALSVTLEENRRAERQKTKTEINEGLAEYLANCTIGAGPSRKEERAPSTM